MSQADAEKTFREALKKLLKLKKSGSNLRVTSKPYFMRFVYDAAKKEVYAEASGTGNLPADRPLPPGAAEKLAELGYGMSGNANYLRVIDFSSSRGHDEACSDFVRVFVEVFRQAVDHGVAYELTLGDGSDTAVEKVLGLAGKLLEAANRRNYNALDNVDGFARGSRGKGCALLLAALIPAGWGTVGLLRHLLG